MSEDSDTGGIWDITERFWVEELKLRPSSGAALEEAFLAAWNLARKNGGVAVSFTFNGTKVVIEAGRS